MANEDKKAARKAKRAENKAQRELDKKVFKLKKQDFKARFSRKNTYPTPEGVSPKRQARRLNRATNPSQGLKAMGDNYGKL